MKNDKKIGAIVTLYKASNYGTYLQALAMQKILEEITEEEVDVISIEERIGDNEKRRLKRRNIFKAIKELLFIIRLYKDEKMFKKGKLNGDYKFIVIGSDELWNVNNVSFSHSGIYLGRGLKAEKIITYAISCNDATYYDFKKVYGEDPFRKITDISVRDENTMKLVEEYGIYNAVRVLDPTFLCDYNIDEKGCYCDEYILVYGYRFSPKEQEDIVAFAKKKGIIIISVGFIHKWCDKNILCSTNKFLSYVKNASYVITSTFHGSVFSIKLNKKFVSFARDNHKVIDLLKHFLLEERNTSKNKIENVMDKDIDYNRINQQIKKEREEAISWLRSKV